MTKFSNSEDLLMPAEWEKQKSTWIAWPHNKEDWPNKFNEIPRVFNKIITIYLYNPFVCLFRRRDCFHG